jgi:hypothetical protein
MAKKITTLRIEPSVMNALKDLAKKHGKPLGDIVEGLVDFIDSARFVTDDDYVKRFNSILETCLINAGESGGWMVHDDDGLSLAFVKRKTLENLEAKKAELEAELHALESDPDYPEASRKQKKIMDDLRSGKRGTRDK